MASKLDRQLVIQTIQGYQAANQITQAERRARLQTMSTQESLAIFVSLYEAWRATGQQAGGDTQKIAERRLAEKIKLRQAFAALAHAKKLI